jgi:tape measure domain-containing protein
MAVKNVLFKIQADTAQLRRELDSIKEKIDGAGKSVSGFGKVLATAGAAFGGIAIGSQLTNFASSSLKAASDFETLNIQFKTFLGSAEEAKKTIGELNDFSVKTPFTPEQVFGAAKSLLAFGLPAGELQDTLKTLGDVSAGTGKDLKELSIIYGQVRSTGKLMGQDLLQLINAGFNPLQVISEKTGKSVADLKVEMEKGNISFENVQQAFKDATAEGGLFFNLTKELSESTAGRISTLEGNFTELKRAIGEGLLPVFELLVDAGAKTIDFFTNLPKIIDQNRVAFAGIVAVLGLSIGALTKDLQLKAKNAIETSLLAAKERILAVVTNLRTNATRIATASTTGLTIAQRINSVATTAGTIAVQGFNAALRANPIGLIISLLGTLAAVFMDFGEEAGTAVEEVEKFANAETAYKDFTEKSKKNTAEEIGSLKKLTEQLKKTSAGSKERKDLIDKVNSTYGVTIKNLSDEKKFIKEVDEGYRSAAEAITIKAKANAAEESLTALFKEQARLTGIISDNEKTIGDTRAKVDQEFKFKDVNTKNLETIVKARTFGADVAISKAKDEKAKVDKAIARIQGDIEATKGITTPGKPVIEVDPTIVVNKAKLKADLEKELAGLKIDQTKQLIEFGDPKNLEETKKKVSELAEIDRKNVDSSIDNRIEEAKANKTYTDDAKKLFEEIRKKRKDIIDDAEKNQLSIVDKQFAERDAKATLEIAEINAEEKLLILQTSNEKLKEESEKAIESLGKAETESAKKAAKAVVDAKLKAYTDGLEKERKLKEDEIIRLRDVELSNVKLTEKEKSAIIAKANLEILKNNQSYLDKKTDATENANETDTESTKKSQDEIVDKIAEVTKATIQLINAVIEARIAETEAAISNQERRIEKAKEIAEKGNAEILQLEEERLDKLNKEKARYVRQQQALALIEIAVNSAIAIAKAAAEGGGVASALTISATLIALAAGFLQAKAQAQSAASFATGGYTGGGGTYDPAGIVHKGEFVFTKEKSSKYRSLFEDIHRGRDPYIAKGIGESIVVVNNAGIGDQITRIEKAIKEQRGLELSISEKGIHGIVTNYNFKESRIRNKAR